MDATEADAGMPHNQVCCSTDLRKSKFCGSFFIPICAGCRPGMVISMKIGVIHANISAVEPIEAAFLSADSDIEVVNFIDPDMLRMVDEAGEVSPAALRRYGRAVFDAADAGLPHIQVYCSTDLRKC